MCHYSPRTVRLHNSGRTFSCAYCARVREHPHFDYLYARDHHAYCDYCGRWMEIENIITSEIEEESNATREEA
jgi:Fe2+ or Zn2+ uptake regulation protein